MKYFKSKTVVTEYTTLSIVIPDGVISYQYTETLAGVDIADSEAFLAQQHPECEVTELTFQDVESELKECRMFHDINAIVQRMIAERYSIPDEIKMVKLPIDHPERVAYQNYVDECRAYGRTMKVQRGLITI